MDYTDSKLLFKLKKLFRYLFIYGLDKTLVKVRGQYHMKKIYSELPTYDRSKKHSGSIAIVGCGNFSYSAIAYNLNLCKTGLIRACMDVNINRAASLYEKYKLLYYTDDFHDILSDPQIRLVFIASNHSTHSEYAVKCIEAGKNVHIEKPHVICKQQLDSLQGIMLKNPDVNVYLGFNRPKSPLFLKLQSFLDRQIGPLMINWFIAGHEISDDHWYFDSNEGGRILGNLCHWTDLTLHLVGLENAFPCKITPSCPNNAKSDFVVSVVFNDQSCASITFSAKGHTFEGVRETLNVHKGDVLANLADFKSLSIDVIDKKYRFKTLFRDHGHKENIFNSLNAVSSKNSFGESSQHINATALFFLAIKSAVEKNESIILSF